MVWRALNVWYGEHRGVMGEEGVEGEDGVEDVGGVDGVLVDC